MVDVVTFFVINTKMINFIIILFLFFLLWQTPEWSQSDVCERCGGPFFWNFKAMWNQRAVGVRQVQ